MTQEMTAPRATNSGHATEERPRNDTTQSTEAPGSGETADYNPYAAGDAAHRAERERKEAERRAAPVEFVHGLHARSGLSTARRDSGHAEPIVSPEDRLDRHLSTEGYDVLVAACTKNGLPVPETFDEAVAVPVAALAGVAPGFAPTVAEAEDFNERNGLRDPHVVVKEALAAKAEEASTAPPTEGVYSLVEAARLFGAAEWVKGATAAWLAGCTVHRSERNSLPVGLTAAMLLSWGATAEEVAKLAPATSAIAKAEALDYAEEQLLAADAARRDRVKEDQRRTKLRGEGYVPLAESFFDFDRDFASLRAPDELIPGLIESCTAVQLIAKPNVGKTFLALAWACSLALQEHHVIYIVADDSTYQFTRRVLGWCAAHDVEPRAVLAFLKLTTRAAQFADSDDVSTLAAQVEANSSAMVVFDTQHQCSEGLVENSNDDSRVIISACKRLTKLGAAVLIVHHTLDGNTGRGAKSMEGAVDTTLAITETAQAGKDYLQVTENKQKNMAKDEPKLYPYDLVEIPLVLRGSVIPDRHRFTKVVRTTADPLDTAAMNPAELTKLVHVCSVLQALKSSTVQLSVTRISKLSREWAKPRLDAKGLLSKKGQMPRGFTDGDVMRTLKALTDVTGGQLVEDVTQSGGKVAYYKLTTKGESELERLLDVLESGA